MDNLRSFIALIASVLAIAGKGLGVHAYRGLLQGGEALQHMPWLKQLDDSQREQLQHSVSECTYNKARSARLERQVYPPLQLCQVVLSCRLSCSLATWRGRRQSTRPSSHCKPALIPN